MLSHLIALCDAKATTTSHAHEVSERPPQKWFFASHHKTGTILLDAILEPIKGLFNPKLSYRLYYSHHIHESVSWSSDVFKYNLIDGQAWARIAHSGHSGIRVVHLIREPVELCISGYWYHLRSTDTQFVPGVSPAILERHDTESGLELNTRGTLKSTLPEIRSAVEAMKDDVRVLTIGLEAFGDDYDLTCKRIYDFLMRGNDEFAKKLPLSRFLRATAVGKHPKNSNHVGDLDEKEVARGIIASSTNQELWDNVRAYRKIFGYVEVCPGAWRFHGDPAPQECEPSLRQPPPLLSPAPPPPSLSPSPLPPLPPSPTSPCPVAPPSPSLLPPPCASPPLGRFGALMRDARAEYDHAPLLATAVAVLLGANAWCFAACALFCCARRLRRRYARFTDEAGPSAASPSSNTAGTELRQGAARRESTGGEHPGVR